MIPVLSPCISSNISNNRFDNPYYKYFSPSSLISADYTLPRPQHLPIPSERCQLLKLPPDIEPAAVDTLLSSSQPVAEKLVAIHQFLNRHVFTQGYELAISRKPNLAVLGPLFYFVNDHIASIEKSDPEVVQKLKVQFANLPSPADRKTFPNLRLTARQKLQTILDSLHKKEARLLSELFAFVEQEQILSYDANYIAKLASDKSSLTEADRQSLRSRLLSRLTQEPPIDWSAVTNVRDRLKTRSLTQLSISCALALYRISKTCRFFESQQELSEEQIFIPQWYHSTTLQNLKQILQQSLLEVRDEACLGAWVSSRREETYGSWGLVMNGKIAELDSEPSFAKFGDYVRWIGLQSSIPLKEPYLRIISRKADKKIEKAEILKLLPNVGFSHVRLFSHKQVDAMQREVTASLGHPDLDDLWWSEVPLQPIYQQNLALLAKRVAADAQLLELTKNESQLYIAQVVQKMALVFYKSLMPRNPTYLPDGQEKRVHLAPNNFLIPQRKILARKEICAREIHGTMHSARTTLWGQVLRLICQKFSLNEPVHPVLLALASALHDAARENEGRDYWDAESAKLLEIILKELHVPDELIKIYVQAIRDKDPKDSLFTTLAQEILQGADCVEIMRLTGREGFVFDKLHLYKAHPEMQKVLKSFVKEAALFIKLTDHPRIRLILEHKSTDFFGDLVRLLFSLQQADPTRFPTIAAIYEKAAKEILQTIINQDLK